MQPTLGAHDHVREQQRKGFVSDDVTSAPDRMPETVRCLLPGKAGCARCRQHVLERFQLNGLAALAQRRFKLGLDVEMVFNDGFVAAGDKHEMLDPGFHCLFHHILHHRLVDHGQHLLGHGLGCRQKAGPQSGNRQDGFSDLARHCHVFSSFFMNISVPVIPAIEFRQYAASIGTGKSRSPA
jgi:hypothetical protein